MDRYKSEPQRHKSLASYILVLTAAASLVSAAAAPTVAQAAAKAPITIGFLDTITGPNAQVGLDSLAGAQIAVREINQHGGVLGHQLKLMVKDEQASPTVSVQDMREFASAHVNIVTGFTLSSDCLAAAPVAAQYGMVIVSSACNDGTLATTNFNPRIFSVATNTTQLAIGAAKFVHQTFPGIATWDNASYDYVTGHADWTDFQTDLHKIQPHTAFGKSVFFPFTATQLSSYITSLLSSVKANSGLFLGTFGAGTIEMAQQGRSYGVFSKYRLVLNFSGSEPTSAALGKSGPKLYYIYDYYYKAYHNAMNNYLVTAYTRTHKTGPDAWAEQGNTAIQVIGQAIAKAGSADTTRVMKALTSVNFQTPRGTAYFRSADHIFVSPVTVWECHGDASAAIGYSCPFYKVVPASETTPAATKH